MDTFVPLVTLSPALWPLRAESSIKNAGDKITSGTRAGN
jgi:hypothetical protein